MTDGDVTDGDVTDGDVAGGEPDEDGYTGPAQLVGDGAVLAVQVRLAGRFEPISGRYQWYGRVAASPELAALLGSGVRRVVLRTPHSEVETALSDVDPWGRPRVSGFGVAPFAVRDRLPD